jgi:cold shock CspA family protein
MDSDAAAQEGVLVSWDDERGFGYIQPEAGGHRVFSGCL